MSEDLAGGGGSTSTDLPIVVYVGDFNEDVGGTIVLHTLAHRLRLQGFPAFLAKTPNNPKAVGSGWIGKLYWALRQANKRRRARRKGRDPARNLLQVMCHPSMPVPTLPWPHVSDIIAVYPEVVSGNPIGARHVVRWLLHRPGFHDAGVTFGEDELTFFYQPEFAREVAGVDPENLLRVRWLRDDIYRNEGRPDRSGTCRIVRKGKATFTPAMASNDAFPVLDGKSHAEIAAVFNQCEVLYSHDPHTMYLYYAALCGCIPVVVPQPGIDAETWRAGFELKQGVAYGDAEIPFAIATRAGLLSDMDAARNSEDAAVKSFAEKIKSRFRC